MIFSRISIYYMCLKNTLFVFKKHKKRQITLQLFNNKIFKK